MIVFPGDSLLFIPSVETQHLLRFRLSSSHAAVCVHSFLKRNDLNRLRFQSPFFKTGLELIGSFPYLLRRQPITIDSKQLGEIVIEVYEVETDTGISRACDNHLPSAECE